MEVTSKSLGLDLVIDETIARLDVEFVAHSMVFLWSDPTFTSSTFRSRNGQLCQPSGDDPVRDIERRRSRIRIF